MGKFQDNYTVYVLITIIHFNLSFMKTRINKEMKSKIELAFNNINLYLNRQILVFININRRIQMFCIFYVNAQYMYV